MTKRNQALTALVGGASVQAAAAAAGVDRRTISRWLAEPSFQEALQAAHREILNEIQAGMVALARQALTALQDVMSDPGQPGASQKRQAAINLLYLIPKWREANEFSNRLEVIEIELGITVAKGGKDESIENERS